MAEKNSEDDAKSGKSETFVKIVIALITLFGTFITAAGTYAAAVVGANAPHPANQPPSVINDIRVGFQILGTSLSERKLTVTQSCPPPAPAAAVVPSPVVSTPTPQAAPTPPAAVQSLQPATAGSCVGLDPKIWAIGAAQVSKVTAGNKGYNVTLRLSNISSQTIGLTWADPTTLNDNKGNQLGVQYTTLVRRGMTPPTQFDAGVTMPVSFSFVGASELGSTVSLNANLISTSDDNGKPQVKPITLGCTDLTAQ